jgi:hypothetical protein
VAHIPAGHPPAIAASRDGELDPAMAAANDEYSCFKRLDWQPGHRSASASAARRRSFSKWFPHSWQEYSWIGIA